MKKRFSIVLSVALAAFALAGCQKNETEALSDILKLSPVSKDVISAGAEIKVGFTANYAVSASCDASWVHLDMQPKYCIVSVDENFEESIRRADVVFRTEKGNSATFALTQFSAQADTVAVSQDTAELPSEGGEFEVNVSSSYDFNVECDYDWVSFIADGSLVKFTVSELEDVDPREALVRFVSVRGASDTLLITQVPGDFLKLDRDTVHVDQNANNIDVVARAYYEVSYETEDAWLSVSPKENKNNFTVTASANTETLSRTGSVVFYTSLGSRDTLVVVQDPVDLISVDVKTRTVSPDAENFDVVVSSIYAYTASCDSSWVHITPVSDGKYNIAVDDHRASREARTAVVKFTSERGATATVTITQGGFWDDVTLSVTSIEATENGARINVAVTTNYPVTATTSESWITVIGSGTSFTVCVARNETSSARSGSVTFKSNHGASASLTVSQQPKGSSEGDGTNLPVVDIIDIDFD